MRVMRALQLLDRAQPTRNITTEKKKVDSKTAHLEGGIRKATKNCRRTKGRTESGASTMNAKPCRCCACGFYSFSSFFSALEQPPLGHFFSHSLLLQLVEKPARV